MKIAIDCRMVGNSGIGTYIESLLPFFVAGNECLLIGSREKLSRYENANVRLLECSVKPFSVKEMFFFPAEMARTINECDLFYTPYCNIPSGIKVPVYCTIHDIVFLDMKLASGLGTFLRKLCYKYAISRSQKIFTVSEFSRQRIIEKLKCRKEIVVTYNGLSDKLIGYISEIQDVPKKPTILFVGNLKAHKGLLTLIEAFKKALEKNLDAGLVIVGSAENFRTKDKNLQEYLLQNNDGRIKFTGKISDRQLVEYYKGARLLVQPSLYEGFGIPPLEALHCGTNVIVSDIPVFKEIYSGFPVTFFKAKDSDDLCEKIIESFDKPNVGNIPDVYSYERTYTIIKNAML